MRVHFLSYPKSGRTWIRFMVNEYLRRLHGTECSNVFQIEKQMDGAYPFEWTHLTGAMLMDLPWDVMGAIRYESFDGGRFIFMTRNFHATMASAYRHAVHRIGRWNGGPAGFLRSERYGVMKLITLCNMWERIHPRLAAFETLSYDALRLDREAALRRCLHFAGVVLQDDVIDAAVDAGSFENMQALGLSPAYAGTPLAPVDPGDPHSFKVREGGAGPENRLYDDADCVLIDLIAENLLVNPDAPWLAGCWNRTVEAVAI